MDAELRKTLYLKVSEVFEKMFFTVLEPFSDSIAGPASAGDYLEAVISYEGGREGTIRFYFPEPLARRITCNFLGIEEKLLTEGQIVDMVKETTNMAVGGLLGELDPKGSCRLGIPACRRRGNFPAGELERQPGACAFNSERGTLWLVLEES